MNYLLYGKEKDEFGRTNFPQRLEIAKELVLPIGTVKARLYRSRELLIAIIRDRKIVK